MTFFWVLFALPMLMLLQRWIHSHLHGVSLLLTGKPERAMIVYAIILLPGVLLHELSHWIMATLVGVRTGSFSLFPRAQSDGSIRLGYVEYYKGRTLGPVRESLIGGAPMIVGTAAILLIGYRIFSVSDLIAAIRTGDITYLVPALSNLFATNDFLVWLYLLFAVSNAMMPSRSDRRAWPAFLLIMGTIATALYVFNLGDVIFAGIADLSTIVFGNLGLALSMAIGVDIVFIALIAGLEGLISRLKGVNVVYGRSETDTTARKITT